MWVTHTLRCPTQLVLFVLAPLYRPLSRCYSRARHGEGQGHSHFCLMGPMFPLRFRLHNVMALWVTHTLRGLTQLVPWCPHGAIQPCATVHKGQGTQYHDIVLSTDRPVLDRFGPLSLALAPYWDTVPPRFRHSPGSNSHLTVPYPQVPP